MKESAVLDRIYYDLAKGAYRNDLGKNYEIKDYTDQKKVLQTWKVRETFHDKQTWMNAVVFGRDINREKQVMVDFRGTEGDKIIEKNSLGIPMKPGKVWRI